MNNKIKIDCTKIPPIELKILCQTFVTAIEKFYDDPKNREEFEDWNKSGLPYEEWRKRREEAKKE